VALVEDRIRRLGGTSIALRVFDHNSTARHVYERSGFQAISTLMRKVL
jgi:predicted GNAT family acetyltransferase